MFENQDKEIISQMRKALEEMSEHFFMVSEGMLKFQGDLGLFAKELNVVKSYLEIFTMVLDKAGIIEKKEMKELVTNNLNKRVNTIQKEMLKKEMKMQKETEDMKHLIEKFKSSINNWFDEDGNPIAKA